MVRKIPSTLIDAPLTSTPANLSPVTSTEVLQHPKPMSMGMLGKLMMRIVENMLPEMVMETISQFMHSVNGIVYSGTTSIFIMY